MSEILNEARRLRTTIEKLSSLLTDAEALDNKELISTWKSNQHYYVDDRVHRGDYLYKCREEHDSLDIYPPELIPAIWKVISLDEGTLESPITAARGMEYEEGKYYLDTEDENIYLCTRAAVLQYMPHELIGHYFETV